VTADERLGRQAKALARNTVGRIMQAVFACLDLVVAGQPVEPVPAMEVESLTP